jgi:hypothetical protein
MAFTREVLLDVVCGEIGGLEAVAVLSEPSLPAVALLLLLDCLFINARAAAAPTKGLFLIPAFIGVGSGPEAELWAKDLSIGEEEWANDDGGAAADFVCSADFNARADLNRFSLLDMAFGRVEALLLLPLFKLFDVPLDPLDSKTFCSNADRSRSTSRRMENDSSSSSDIFDLITIPFLYPSRSKLNNEVSTSKAIKRKNPGFTDINRDAFSE